MKSLRKLAHKYPDCVEGIACKGTAIECTTFKLKGKAFLFVGRADIRLKLSDSVTEAKKLAAKEPTRYTIGANGWTKITFTEDEPLPLDVVTRWLGESYQLMAPKQKAPPAKRPRKGKSGK
jgi:hypothetical protein